jgi:hypothetical protein
LTKVLFVLLCFGISEAKTAHPANSKSSNTILHADLFPGRDLGAQINAANASLASGCGEIWITESGTISTPVLLSACRTLRFLVPTTWSEAITLGSDDHIIGRGADSLVTGMQGKNFSYINGTSVQNDEIEGIDLTVNSAGSKGTYLATFRASSDIDVHHNVSMNAHLVQFDTTAANYAAVSTSNITTHVNVSHNRVTVGSEDNDASIVLIYTQDFNVSDNKIEGGYSGIQWWGGDADPTRNGARNNTRWTKHGMIANNYVHKVAGGGIWGSMGDSITVAANSVEDCGDVCLDAEGSNNIAFTGNFAKDGKGGGTAATFFYNRDIIFSGNTIVNSSANWPLFRIHNVTNSAVENLDVHVLTNRFDCQDPLTPCLLYSEAVQRLDVRRNEFRNARLALVGLNLHFIDVGFNKLIFDRGAAASFNAIDVQNVNALTGTSIPGLADIHDNTIESRAPQPSGSVCIYGVFADSNASDRTRIRGNKCLGKNPFATDIAVVGNSANPKEHGVWSIRGNVLASQKIVHTITQGEDSYELGVNYGSDRTKILHP